MKDVVMLTGAGQIGMAIARRTGYGKKIIVADNKEENARKTAAILLDAGFDATAAHVDIASRDCVLRLIDGALSHGRLVTFINAAGVSPSQASIESILAVDLYGTAMLLEEVGKVIAEGGAGVTISSQSGHRLPALGDAVDEELALTPADRLLELDVLRPENIRDSLHAYQLAKRCNVKRVMAEAVKWGERGARINSISPGIIVTPLAVDEFNGPRGDFYKDMFTRCPAKRPGTADEIANVAELLLSERGPSSPERTFSLTEERRPPGATALCARKSESVTPIVCQGMSIFPLIHDNS